MENFPFYPIVGAAIFVHIISGGIAVSIEKHYSKNVWKNTYINTYLIMKMFSIKREEVRFKFNWVLLIVSRYSLIFAAVVFVASMFAIG